MAVGNPLGLQSSVTQGIVSALGRDVAEPGGVTLPGTIQTSAAINPGNSGGALVDINGDVVGIPTLAAVDQELGGSAPGIGFAIPSNDAKDFAGQLIKNGKVTASHRAYLGIQAANVTGEPGRAAGRPRLRRREWRTGREGRHQAGRPHHVSRRQAGGGHEPAVDGARDARAGQGRPGRRPEG